MTDGKGRNLHFGPQGETIQVPQHSRAREAGFAAGLAASLDAGAVLKCWSKRAEFIGRGRAPSPIETGVQSIASESSLFMEPHPCYLCLSARRGIEEKMLATRSVSGPECITHYAVKEVFKHNSSWPARL